jgi:hypothetical protein
MHKLLTIFLTLSSTVSMAQVSSQLSGPVSGKPAYTALSETLANTAQQARNNRFLQNQVQIDLGSRPGKIPPSLNADSALSSALSRALSAEVISPNVAPLARTAPIPAIPPYLQTNTYQTLNIVPGVNFEGLGLGTPGFSVAGAPSSATLAVSPTQVVQWVNSDIAVYNKLGTPLLPAPGFIKGNAIWSPLGATSLCATTNRGNPMVQYDRISQRWVLTQFAFNAAFTSNSQCIAVSQTNDATGAYYLYEYSFGTELPNDPKLSVWTDGYYITYNLYTNGASFSGSRSCAYDKAAMLIGAASATNVCFTSPASGAGARFGLLPADLDGSTLPPPGTPNLQMSWNWPFAAAAPYQLKMYKFKANFVTPALSTFDDGLGGGPLSSIDFPLDASTIAACSDNAGSCVPQLGTTQVLDTVAKSLYFRLVYRNFGTHEALLFTQAVDPSTSPVAAVRWWEIRDPNGNPVVYQNSTYAPGSESRWSSSAAFDKRGNIAIGYTASSATINPSIRLTGRLRNDPKNLMRTEIVVQAGTGSQTTTLARWGDYSAMQIDPTDDCTFWYTSQYLRASGTFNWRTRIASFKFPNCQ